MRSMDSWSDPRRRGRWLNKDENDKEDRLVELITHLAECSTYDARRALAAAGPRADGLSAVAQALASLRSGAG